MSERFILALDQGTTSSRAILFDHSGRIRAISQKEFTQHYPQPGWVEHDAQEIWSSQKEVMFDLLQSQQLSGKEIAAIGITNQRETTILWDRKTGEPVGPAIVWQDRRTAGYCDQLRQAGHEEMIQSKTGLVIDAYFSATKIRWLLHHHPELRARAERGELAFGTVDSWLLWKLSGGARHVTDVTNASRTMLFNIHHLDWDPELLELFEVPSSLLPEVCSNSEVIAHTRLEGLDPAVPIAGMAGDQQSALFGQMCVEKGTGKNTYGTGCFLVMNTGKAPVNSENNLITTIGFQLDGETHYALEGSIFVGGAVIQWLRDELKLVGHAAESEDLAQSVDDNGGVYFVPALTGLGAPYWDQYARGAMFGITRGTTPAHIVRAALEAITFQVDDVLRAMQADLKTEAIELRVDGGAVANDLLMQLQADTSQCPVVRPETLETTALGAAYLAGLATGFWSGIEELKKQWRVEREFKPQMPAQQAGQNRKWWEKAVSRTLNWLEAGDED